ncbi:MAG: hypothetical protein AVDCRST_MAG11-1006, partial [uncultured Gemmatimonadaceae bacterium]
RPAGGRRSASWPRRPTSAAWGGARARAGCGA